LEERFHRDDFPPPDWRNVSTAMFFFLQIGGTFHKLLSLDLHINTWEKGELFLESVKQGAKVLW
jgi:hypothetical protein